MLSLSEATDLCVTPSWLWVGSRLRRLLLTDQFHALKSSSILCPSCRTLLPSRGHLPPHTHTQRDRIQCFLRLTWDFLSSSPPSLPRLPSSVNVEKVTSSLSPDGVLTVEAPLNLPAIEASETSIPVTVDKKTAVEQK